MDGKEVESSRGELGGEARKTFVFHSRFIDLKIF